MPPAAPAIIGVEVEEEPGGLTVSWEFLHTGGSDIELIEILLRESRDGAPFELVTGGNFTRPLNDSFLIGGSELQAGQSYEVGVRATNDLGVSELTVSQIPDSTVGMFNRAHKAYLFHRCVVSAHYYQISTQLTP